MEIETKAAIGDPKIDLFEDDDEFEEFQINQEWDEKEEGKEIAQQWEDDWDDDDVNDDFSLQLRRELENNSEKSQVYAPLFFLLLRLILLFVRQSLDGIMLYCFSVIVENSW
ncbi:hypothetical protein CISIN_1g041448mg [Citrus sinensis]|uniref:26S proteasome complex subunit SEM1 n=2 Tax=Citrus TaxID=2706 RepID=A0A067FSU4_CITSI|nr:hypothetical protein CISIN_1g041448mg [Citrus sinensis]